MCTLVFLEDPPCVSYDAEYLVEEDVLSSGSAEERFRLTERMADIVSVRPPGLDARLLDIGIGDGTFLHAAEQAGYSTAGLDINAEAVALARRKYGLNAEISTESLSRAFRGTQFDVIHLNEVVEHLMAPLEMLTWCREHIRPGGVMVIQTGNIESIASRIKGDAWDYIRPYHVVYFSRRSMAWALGQARFRADTVRVVDWRVRSAMRALPQISTERGRAGALRWLVFVLSCKLPSLRRSLLVRARPA